MFLEIRVGPDSQISNHSFEKQVSLEKNLQHLRENEPTKFEGQSQLP